MTQTQVETVINNAQYYLATLVNSNLTAILSGSKAVKKEFINYFRLNLLGLEYQDARQDYTSQTTITLYTRLLGMLGINTSIPLDPNYQGYLPSAQYYAVSLGDPRLTTNASGQLVFSDPSLINNTGYAIYPTQLDNFLSLTQGVDVNYSQGYFTIIVPGFQLVAGYPILVFPRLYNTTIL